MDTIFDLPHSERNPRNSEGSFARLSDGRILFAYSKFTGTKSDDGVADIAARCSSDEGRTWTADDRILVRNDAMNVMSVSLLRLKNDRLSMLYLRKRQFTGNAVECLPVLTFSDDDGQTWFPPREITSYPPSLLVVNNDRMIQLESGRILIPAAFHRYNSKANDHRAISLFFYSDDNGQTWSEAEDQILPPDNKMRAGLQEPGLVELPIRCCLMAYFRTTEGAQYKSFSSDGGNTWSNAVRADEFLSPCSPLSIKRRPSHHELFAVWNDQHPRWNIPKPDSTWMRTPLVLARSSDEGRSWHCHEIIESEPNHGYCYTAMFFTDDALLLAYCCGGAPDGSVTPLQDLRIRRIELS